jgi:hypothetical protein
MPCHPTSRSGFAGLGIDELKAMSELDRSPKDLTLPRALDTKASVELCAISCLIAAVSTMGQPS